MTSSRLSLVGDIGGTHARFALVAYGSVQLQHCERFRCRDFQTLNAALYEYLRRCGVSVVSEACLAVAARIDGSQVQMTNNPWQFSRQQIRRDFGWDEVRVINDFTAMALGVQHVSDDQLVHVFGGPGDAGQPRLVIGPGTGLGVSGLVPTPAGWVPLVSEGGHVDFAATNDLELAILKHLQARFGRVSAERVVCAEGLMNLYQAHAHVAGQTASMATPEQITRAAMDGADPLSERTLAHFCEILGRVAGDAVLTLGATGGVFLCGGMIPEFLSFFVSSPFKRAFHDKGRRRTMVESAPVMVVKDNYTGLRGAAEALAVATGCVRRTCRSGPDR